MGYITRDIDSYLVNWKVSPTRKTLLLRGARQVGKTSSVKQFAKSFSHFIEINFLFDKRARKIFEREELDPDKICSELSALYEKPIIEGETLLFLDEIQESIPAIEALRFFYEKKPGLHVLAAGSLLEFALEKIASFGVGRVDSAFMRPLNFSEFLVANKKNALLEKISEASQHNPLSEVLHTEALAQLKTFLIIGGLPEVVTTFLSSKDFNASTTVISNLYNSYEDDFAKYRGKVPSIRLSDTLKSVAQQAGKKFIYKHAYVDAVSAQVHNACRLLEMASLVSRVTHTSANGVPLGIDANNAKFKLKIFDLGIYQKLSGISPKDLIAEDLPNFVHRGALSEIFVGNELLATTPINERGELWYWHREEKSANAEVDYVIQHKNEIVPLEVKAGTKGSMKSMRRFITEKKSKRGIRITAENFSSYGDILVVPLYAVSQISRVLDESIIV